MAQNGSAVGVNPLSACKHALKLIYSYRLVMGALFSYNLSVVQARVALGLKSTV